MEKTDFKSWLDLYKRAWMTRDPELIRELFTDDASYQEKPFELPMNGLEAIRDYWKVVSETQEDVKFNYQILGQDKNQGIAHWSASFIRRPQKTLVKLDGIMIASLNSDNKCTAFQEWWQSKKNKNFLNL